MAGTIKIILNDPQVLTNAGMVHLLEHSDEINLIHPAQNKEEVLQSVSELEADILIVDPRLEGSLTIGEIDEIKERHPNLEILIVTDDLNIGFVQQVIQLGINGFLTKKCDREEVSNAIGALSKKSRFYCNRVLDVILDSKHIQETAESPLSEREQEIVVLIAKGFSTQEIAQRLHLSHHTINTHRKNILKKLGLKTTVDVVLYAVNKGWVEASN